MNPLIQRKTTILLRLIAGVLTCFAISPMAQAVVPAPDGGYPGGNTAEGQAALLSLTTGGFNTAVGYFSLRALTTGNFNTAIGAATLAANTGNQNTATGAGALLSNTTGFQNTANGAFALFSNTTGGGNTANGREALYSNTTGSFNTATGLFALNSNTTADDNTATGDSALTSNTTGVNNTANGAFALQVNTTGGDNTANGANALGNNTTGTDNTANGVDALYSNTTGGDNTANGYQALYSNTTGSLNTANGFHALVDNTIGNYNTALGVGAGFSVTTANNVICIGASVFGENVDDSCFIGNIYSNVQPIVGTDPDSVTITSTGRLGRGNVSSRRYKHDIQPMEKASEALYALKPVSFRYNKEYDATQTLAFGLIAEEVAEVYPDLVGCNPKGEPESVRYEQINAMLLNEFLKEHRKNEQQEATIARLQKQIETLTAGLQKISAQIELSRPAPQTALNKP